MIDLTIPDFESLDTDDVRTLRHYYSTLAAICQNVRDVRSYRENGHTELADKIEQRRNALFASLPQELNKT